jgi:general secretion pathway protein I
MNARSINRKPTPTLPCTRKEYAGGYPGVAQGSFRSQGGNAASAPPLRRGGWEGLGVGSFTPPNSKLATPKGFTLIEVLVALFILAITMAAVSRTASSSINHVDALRTRVIADWVAQNRLAQHQARGDFPPPGIQTGEEEQAGQTYPWQEEVITTPNPTMRRIIVSVHAPNDTQHTLRELTGYLVQFPR